MGGNSSKLPDSYNIVIIGGGFAGCEFAMKLKEKSNKFTLIDGKEAMHINTGALRASVEASFAKKTLISYKEMFGDNFKHGVVRAIDTNAKTVTLVAGDEVVTYTHLVIATGSVGLFPAKLMMTTSTADALLLYRKQVEEIRGAKSIVIIGGGAVGVELAGEIATDYKDKQVTIIHPHHFLVSGTMSERFQKEVKEQLKILNVKLILGERVMNIPHLPEEFRKQKFKVRTEEGTEIETELAIRCTGLTANKFAYAATMGDKMTIKGQLKVNEYFQVEGCENVYAIGDCNNVDETKMAYRAGQHADLLLDNLVKESEEKEKTPYKPGGTMMLLSIGREGGVFHLPNGFIFGSFPTRHLKSKDVFVGKYWKESGLKCPQD